jgi:hypothetical protein
VADSRDDIREFGESAKVSSTSNSRKQARLNIQPRYRGWSFGAGSGGIDHRLLSSPPHRKQIEGLSSSQLNHQEREQLRKLHPQMLVKIFMNIFSPTKSKKELSVSI